MPCYTITEPHPTVPENSYTHSGRGGAGNTFRAPQTTSPSGVATTLNPSTKQTTRFYSGRGGAGNAHSAAARTGLNFEEEYAAAAARANVHHGHVGRGGAGNVFGSSKAVSDAGSRRDSASTDGSVRSGFWGRLSSVSLRSN